MLRLVFAGMLIAALPQARADDGEDDRFNLSLGAFFVQRTDASIRLDRKTGPVSVGATAEWSRDLGGDDAMTVPRLDGFYRFSPKHRMDFSWFKLDRTGSKVLSRTLDIGDQTFTAGTTVNSEYLTETVKAAYTYSFYRAPEIETSLSIGAHITRLKFAIESSTSGQRESAAVTVPLPVIGFRLAYQMAPKWWVKTNYELFFFDQIEGIEGAMSDFTLGVEYLATKHIGVGFGLNRNSSYLEGYEDSWSGRTDSVLNGYLLYLTLR